MYQQITLVGNLGNNPELRYTPDGVPVTSFRLAVNKSWKNSEGQWQSGVTWFRITSWRQQAIWVDSALKKADRILIIGEIEDAHVYIDKNGQHKATIEVTSHNIKKLNTSDKEDYDSSGEVIL